MSLREKARLGYLDAMGINSWVHRRALVNAKPSPRLIPVGGDIDEVPLVARGVASSDVPSVAREQLKQAIAFPKTEEPKLASPVNTIERSDLATVEDEDIIHCHLSFFQMGEVAILVDLPETQGIVGLQRDHRIMIGDAFRLLQSATGVNNGMAENEVRWPWFANGDESLAGAQDLIMGMLEARMPKRVLFIGESANKVMPPGLTMVKHNCFMGLDALAHDQSARVELAQVLLDLSKQA